MLAGINNGLLIICIIPPHTETSLSHFFLSHNTQTAFMDDENGNVVVAASQHHGRGLFGTRAFTPNEVSDAGW